MNVPECSSVVERSQKITLLKGNIFTINSGLNLKVKNQKVIDQ